MRQRQATGSRWRTARTSCVLAGVLLWVGCAANPRSSAEVTLRSYAKAIAQDDARSAYQLLSPSLAGRISQDEFAKQWRENRRELDEQRRQIDELLGRSGHPVREEALVRLSQGSAVRLVAQPRKLGTVWQLGDANLQSVSAPTPHDTLKLLLFAVEQRNYSALLRLLSTEERRALEAQLTERIERLRAALVKPTIEVRGDRARIEYDPRFFIELVREGDSWRIADLN